MSHREDLVGAEMFDTGVPIVREEEARTSAESVVGRMIDEALQWRRENLDPVQQQATDYYQGEPFGDEEEGRSQVVSTDVRDAVRAILPSLMRIFFGPDEVVEFRPDRPETVELAEQQTKGVNYVVKEDNEGFLTMYEAFKDALIRKQGVIKYWWEDKTEVLGSEHTGLTAEQIALLQQQPDIDIEFQEDEAEDELLEAQGETFDVVVRRVKQDGRVRLDAVPPEEFIWSPSARSKDDARLIGHVREVPADELVAMGVARDQVKKHLGKQDEPAGDQLEMARRIDEQDRHEDTQPDATRPVQFAEVYVRLDEDGDGISELHQIWCIGKNWEWAVDENGETFDVIVDEAPFAIFPPDPEPHSMVGLSTADNVMDLQRIKSAVTRGMLDSLAQHLRPVTEVVEGRVNMKDVLNPEVGRVVRVTQPGQMREVPTEFVGQSALPVLQYVDEMKENRTGMSKAAAGLDADALQSSTRAAVAATMGAAQQRIELIARLFAETGMKDLYRGILRLLIKHQNRERMVRIAGDWVQMDPRQWKADMDVTVNVALGSGMAEEKMQILSMVADKQEQLLANGAPIVGFREYRNTLGRLVELAGFENDNEFFKPFGEKEEQAFQQAQAQAEQEPTAEERMERVEMAKIQQRQQEKAMELALKAKEAAMKDDRERDKIVRDFQEKLLELGVEVEEQKLQAARDALDQDMEKARLTGDILEQLANIEIGGGQEQETANAG